MAAGKQIALSPHLREQEGIFSESRSLMNDGGLLRSRCFVLVAGICQQWKNEREVAGNLSRIECRVRLMSWAGSAVLGFTSWGHFAKRECLKAASEHLQRTQGMPLGNY